ncbi:retrovirus-related pol polyprotein from transposon TNT 1-94 [Tanacetum coccineum]
MFDANHDVYFLEFVNDVNVRSKSKSTKRIKKKKTWKPTGKVFTDIGYRLSKLFSGTVRFRNDQIAKIMGYGDYQIGKVMISQVYYAEGIYDDILSYLSLVESVKDQVLVMALKAISFELRLHHYTSQTRTGSRVTQIKVLEGLLMFRMPMRIQSINGRKYILVIVDDYSRFTWAEAVAAACFTQNRSLIRKHHNKTPDELLHYKKPDLSYLHIFGALCYPTINSGYLGKLKPKADIGVFVAYAPIKKAFWIYNKSTRLIIETIHVDFDELTAMASEQFCSGPGPHLLTSRTISSGLVPNPPSPTPYVPPTKKD